MPNISPRGVDLAHGEYITLKPLGPVAGPVVNAVGTPTVLEGERDRFLILLRVDELGTAFGDKLDAFIDVMGPDQETWVNAIHFTTQVGTGDPAKELGVISGSGADKNAVVNVINDAASGEVRAKIYGAQIRARWTITQ